MLDYHDAADINFAKGPVYVLIVNLVFFFIAYEVLKGKRVPTQQLVYNKDELGVMNKLRRVRTGDSEQQEKKQHSPAVELPTHPETFEDTEAGDSTEPVLFEAEDSGRDAAMATVAKPTPRKRAKDKKTARTKRAAGEVEFSNPLDTGE